MNKRLLTGIVIGSLALASCGKNEQSETLRKKSFTTIDITGEVKEESKIDVSNAENKRRGTHSELYTLILKTENKDITFKAYASSKIPLSLEDISKLEALVKQGDEVKIQLSTKYPYVVPGTLRSEYSDFSYVSEKSGEIGSIKGDVWRIKEVNGKSQ